MTQEFVQQKSLINGSFHLVDVDAVIELYKKAGINMDNDDEEGPDYIVNIDGLNYLFTGWMVKHKGKDCEFVIKLNDFSTEEIDSIGNPYFDDELSDEDDN